MTDTCLVCRSGEFRLLYPATFTGSSWKEAAPLFLTHRVKAVHGNIVQCQDCDFIFTSPRFSDEEYDKIYRAVPEGPGASPHATTKRFKRFRDGIERHCRDGFFMDIGCGDGSFALGMGSSYRFVGIELGGSAQTRVVPNGEFLQGEFVSLARQKSSTWNSAFDFVTAWDVIEHIPSLDEFFIAVSSLLKPGGLFFATLPDIESPFARLSGKKWNCLLLEHLWYFSPKTFATYALRFGFECMECKPSAFPVDLRTLCMRGLQTYAPALVPLSRLVPATLAIPFPAGIMWVALRKAI
jgi:SAM-dependent methyltransferase